jgi:hypothetical protein
MRGGLAALAAAIALTGCATQLGGVGYHVQAERALLAAEGAYNAAAKAELAAKTSGLLTGDGLARGEDMRKVKGPAALKIARDAYNHGQVPDTTALLMLAADLTALIPAKGH